MINKYLTPDFDVTVYEIEDVITVSMDPDGYNGYEGNGSDGWWD